MGILYVHTGGSATNSGSSDNNAADLSGAAATAAATVVTLDGSPTLTGLVTSGAAQSSIYLAQATNSNRKIFWITAFDNALKTVTVDVAPTGITSSGWAIGGRIVHTPANVEAALRAGDIYEFGNTPATRTTTYLTARANGTSAAGRIMIRGKTGSRPVLNVTNTATVLTLSSQDFWSVENLELDQDGATGLAIAATSAAAGLRVVNVKISDAGGIGINIATGATLINNEISGTGGDAINESTASIGGAIVGNYIHDCAADGIEYGGTDTRPAILFNIIDTCAGRGIFLSGATAAGGAGPAAIVGNTVYNCTLSGLEVTDADTVVTFYNNIFHSNGTAGAGEFNVEWAAGSAENLSQHGNNIFYQGGAGGNLSNVTANATETTTDPLMTDPANGDFTLGSSSPAKATGFPGVFLGSSTGYMDIGAVQRQESASGGGMLRHPGMRGGLNG